MFCLERSISEDGQMNEAAQARRYSEYDREDEVFFMEESKGKHVPRALFFDSEPSTIDGVRTGAWQNLFDPDMLINSKEDASGLFACGRYSIGQ